MNDDSNKYIDFKGGCLTTIGILLVIYLIVKLLPFILLFSSLTVGR